MKDIARNACDFLRDYATQLQKNGSFGFMVFRLTDKNLRARLWAPRKKIYIKFQGDFDSKIIEFIDSVYAAMTTRAESYQDGTTNMLLANWFFAEITSKTKNLTDTYKLVISRDFYDLNKTYIYFDMDIKDQMAKSYAKTLTTKQKNEFLLETNKKSIDYLKSLDPVNITLTGNGLHVGFIAEGGVPIPRKGDKVYADIYKKLMVKLKKNTGWSFDAACSSLHRIDRLPFTYNVKSDVIQEDSFAESLELPNQPSGKFLSPMREQLDSVEVRSRVTAAVAEATIYSTFGLLKEMSPKAYKYIKTNLSFKKVFDYFKITDKVGYVPFDEDEDGFKSCYSPFRTKIFDGMAVEQPEALPSFRYDEDTFLWYDFGRVPFYGAGCMGDSLGLAHSLWFAQKENIFPPRLAEREMIDIALTIIGGKTQDELQAELTTFVRDENDTILADFSTTLQVFLDYLLGKYEVLYAKEQTQLFFKEWNDGGELRFFPDFCVEFGNKKSSTTARYLLDVNGIANPSRDLQTTATQVVDFLKDMTSVVVGDIYAHYSHDAVAAKTFPVMTAKITVLEFDDSIFYHINAKSITSSYDGFAYRVHCKYIPTEEAIETPYWDKLLEGLVGPKDSPQWTALMFMFAQMWFPAHGDSRALIIHGFGRNGKSTFTKIVQQILPANITLPCTLDNLTGTDTTNSSQRMDLLGKKLVVIGDLAEYTMPKALKGLITGEGDVNARHLYKNSVKFPNTASIIMMANSLPLIVDDVYAFLRRFLLIRSPKTVAVAIPDLAERIIADEMAGVWQYIIRSIEYFREFEFILPETQPWVKQLVRPMKRTLIHRMNGGEMIMALKPTPGAAVRLKDLYNAYIEVAIENNVKRPQYKTFVEKIVAVVQTDTSFYNEDWETQFKDVGMEEGVYIIYNRYGTADVLGNLRCVGNGKDIPNVASLGLGTVIKEYNASQYEYRSVRTPGARTMDIMSKLREYSRHNKTEDIGVVDFQEKPVPKEVLSAKIDMI